MSIEYHTPTLAHLRECRECQARMEFLNRLQTETIVVGEELGLSPGQAISMLVTLACNMADVNECLEDLLEHMTFTSDQVAERICRLDEL